MTLTRGSSRGPAGCTARGAATAELAVALPVLVAVTIAMAWFVSLGLAQVRVVDAARETARALARGEDQGAAIRRGRVVGPRGTVVSVSTGSQIRVRAKAVVRGPGGIFRLAEVTVHASAVAADEDGEDSAAGAAGAGGDRVDSGGAG